MRGLIRAATVAIWAATAAIWGSVVLAWLAVVYLVVMSGIEWREVADGNWVQAQYSEIGVRAAPASAPADTAAPAPAATQAPQPTLAPQGGVAVRATVVPTNGLNVRSGPDPNASVAFVAPGASELELTGETVVNGDTWWRLTDGNWVQGQLLSSSVSQVSIRPPGPACLCE